MDNGVVRNQRVSKKKVAVSRALRKEMTDAERRFWELVRNRKLFGLKFRRQQIIDGFVVDFYCDEIGLCVELDGGVHDSAEQQRYDKERDDVIMRRGLRILRIPNAMVLDDWEGVVAMIKNLTPGPLLGGEGEEPHPPAPSP